MTTAYFLTGSLNDQDNDFEIKVSITGKESALDTLTYDVSLTDLSVPAALLWQASGPDFLACLQEMEGFLSDNFITLYSKIRTSAERDSLVDKELEGFILNHLDY